MTTISYPAVGTGGFTEARWAEFFDSHNGIINDFDGTSLVLTPISVGNFARYSTGSIMVAGYVLKVVAPHDLTVSTAAGTYYTWACYDPALNVADGGGDADPDGPCTLGISTGLPSTSGDKQYVLLDKIVRAASQALTAATVTSYRTWLGPSIEMATVPAPFTLDELEWTTSLLGHDHYPLGSTLHIRDRNLTFHRALEGGDVFWRGDAAPSVDFDNNSPLTAAFTPPAYRVTQGQVFLSGTLKRVNGNNLTTGSDVSLGTMPVGARPAESQRFPCAARTTSSTYVTVVVLVDATTGGVTMHDLPGSTGVLWVDLSGVTYRAEK